MFLCYAPFTALAILYIFSYFFPIRRHDRCHCLHGFDLILSHLNIVYYILPIVYVKLGKEVFAKTSRSIQFEKHHLKSGRNDFCNMPLLMMMTFCLGCFLRVYSRLRVGETLQGGLNDAKQEGSKSSPRKEALPKKFLGRGILSIHTFSFPNFYLCLYSA